MMDLTGVEPVSKIHTLYNCLRCFKNIIKESSKMISGFWTSPATTDTSLFFGCGQAAILYSKLLFIFNLRWLRHQSSAIIYFKTLSKPFQALKSGRLPPRPQGNNQVSSFNLTHLRWMSNPPYSYLLSYLMYWPWRGEVGLPVFHLYQLYSLHDF